LSIFTNMHTKSAFSRNELLLLVCQNIMGIVLQGGHPKSA
jgi:hypothetical protein